MPITGDINVTIYGGDRELWSGGKVDFQLLDPFSNTEKVVKSTSTKPKTQTLLFKNVPADFGQRYSLLASAKGHRMDGVFPLQPRKHGLLHTAVMIIRNDPQPNFSEFSFQKLAEVSPRFEKALTDGGTTEQSFLAITPETRISVTLNIEAKLRNTFLSGVPASEFIKKIDDLKDLEEDRIRAWVDPAMPQEVQKEAASSGLFDRLPEWANELEHKGYPVSFKQRVAFGSLQLSFAKEPKNGLLEADIDIDLYYGIGHIGEWFRNKITRNKTDPFTVYMQLFDQRIFPLYTLNT